MGLSADTDQLAACTNSQLHHNKHDASFIQSPDQDVSQGAEQAEGGDWSEISQQEAG